MHLVQYLCHHPERALTSGRRGSLAPARGLTEERRAPRHKEQWAEGSRLKQKAKKLYVQGKEMATPRKSGQACSQ